MRITVYSDLHLEFIDFQRSQIDILTLHRDAQAQVASGEIQQIIYQLIGMFGTRIDLHRQALFTVSPLLGFGKQGRSHLNGR